MSYNNEEVKSEYDMDAVRNGTLLVGNEGLVKSADIERRYTSRGVEESNVLRDRPPAIPVRDIIGTLAAYSARGKLPLNW